MEMCKFSVRIPLSQVEYIRTRARQKRMSINYLVSQLLLIGAQTEVGRPRKNKNDTTVQTF